MKVLVSDKIYEPCLEDFKAKGIEVDYEPEITAAALEGKIKDYDALIVRSRTKVTKEIIEAAANLKIIGRVGSGLDNIEIAAAEAKKIKVVNAGDANAQAVAEHTVGLILASLRNYKKAFKSMDEGQWLKNELSGQELGGKMVGILGFGHIGQRVGKILEGFGVKLLVYKRGESLEDFFGKADIITVHLPLNEETTGMISAKVLSRMRPGTIFINTSRGEIVEEEALIQLIKLGKIKAGLDVFSTEPLPENNQFRQRENLIITPHLGASTKEAGKRASEAVVEEVIKELI